ncbi:MAG: hypothetical protein V4689_05665 [Verrucomicrobiota bacterium]
MSLTFRTIFAICLTSFPLMAGTVVITSVPDEAHPLQPLTSLDGVPLTQGTQVRVGAFPGLNDNQVLDLASQGGLVQVAAEFVSFGSPCNIGQGVEGAAGGFEVAVKDSDAGSPWVGQTVSILIQTADGEFLVARFPDKVFEAESATGLEPLLSLHLADAKLIVGSRQGEMTLATSIAPPVGSFGSWLAGFPSISDPELKLPSADADSDGRSNFLEYATGGDPASPADPAACRISPDAEGGLWVRFNRVNGLGSIRYTLETSDQMSSSWLEATGNIEPDPESPASMRLHLSAPLPSSRFFRLNVESTP